MSGSIVLVLGSHAQECAAALAGPDGVAMAASAFNLFPYFTPLRPVFIWAGTPAEVWPWKRQAAGVLDAHSRFSAAVMQGRVRGRGRGKEIKWGQR